MPPDILVCPAVHLLTTPNFLCPDPFSWMKNPDVEKWTVSGLNSTGVAETFLLIAASENVLFGQATGPLSSVARDSPASRYTEFCSIVP